MTNEEILLAKKNYKNLLLEKQKLEKYKQRIEELEKNAIVNEYLGLIDLLNQLNEKLDETDMFYDSFEKIAKTTNDSNKILVYMGSYSVNVLSGTKCVSDTNKYVDFMQYEDLETGKIYRIEPYKRLSFEKNHVVIDLFKIYPDLKIYKDQGLIEVGNQNGIRRLRKQFFCELLEKPQEAVVKQLKNYKK